MTYLLTFGVVGLIAALIASHSAEEPDEEALAEWMHWWSLERFRCAVHGRKAPLPARGSFHRWKEARQNIEAQLSDIGCLS